MNTKQTLGNNILTKLITKLLIFNSYVYENAKTNSGISESFKAQ